MTKDTMDHGSKSLQHERYANMANFNFTSDPICKKNHLEKDTTTHVIVS